MWLAGLRLARYADAIAEQTGLSHAFVGALLLGGTTSLPEIATTVSAALLDNVALAVNNALGSAPNAVGALVKLDIFFFLCAVEARERGQEGRG